MKRETNLLMVVGGLLAALALAQACAGQEAPPPPADEASAPAGKAPAELPEEAAPKTFG